MATLIHDGFMNPIDGESHHMLCGCLHVSSLFSAIPLVIKQRLQMYNTPYRSAVHCASQVFRTEGITAFYRSYTTQLTMNIPFQVVHFVTYEFQQDVFNPTRRYYPLSHMLSGAGAGAFAAAATNPLDVAKTFLNTHRQSRSLNSEQRVHGMFGALAKIYQAAGIRGYFRGLTARVLYQAPSTAICWSVYEFFKYWFGLKKQEEMAIANITANASSNSR